MKQKGNAQGGIFPGGSNVISEIAKCREETIELEIDAENCATHCWDFECDENSSQRPYTDQINGVVLTNFQPCKVKIAS